MEKQPVFKTSLFGGFERQSVLNYIFEMNNNAKAVQDRLSAQFDEVSAAREKLSESIRVLESKLAEADRLRESVANELRGERTKNDDLNSMLDSLNDEIIRQNKIIEDKDAEISRFEARNAELEQLNAELEGKKKEIEKASVYMGDLVVRARLDAERILEEANDQARGVVEEATKSLGSVFDQFNKFRQEMETIEAKIEEAVVSMQQKFAAIGDTISESESNIRGFYRPSNITLVGDDKGTETEESTSIEHNFFRGAAE